jgi:two-component system OmpR family response regulator
MHYTFTPFSVISFGLDIQRMKLLLVEDDDLVADSLALALSAKDYSVERVKDGLQAELSAMTGLYDLIILDLGLPGIDGLECLQMIRKRLITTPVLILTAWDGPEQKIAGLDAGANDYVIKPFHLGELLARIRALLRLPSYEARTVTIGELQWDAIMRVLRRGDEVIDLSPKEHAVLEILFRNLGSLVTKQRLALLLGDNDAPATDNAIDIVVYRLRKRLEPFGLKLRTIRGLGFLAEG